MVTLLWQGDGKISLSSFTRLFKLQDPYTCERICIPYCFHHLIAIPCVLLRVMAISVKTYNN